MANERHGRILAQGVHAWNQWRAENPEVRPDLADLRVHDVLPNNRLGADLSHVDFRNADLNAADLYQSWLVGADLSGAMADDVGFGGVPVTISMLVMPPLTVEG
jgi:hypothetical protein